MHQIWFMGKKIKRMMKLKIISNFIVIKILRTDSKEKNKLKSYFEDFKSFLWKLRGEKK